MLQVVAPEWLEECLAVGSRVEEQKYRIQLEYCCDSGEAWPDLCCCCAVLAVLCRVGCAVLCRVMTCCAVLP